MFRFTTDGAQLFRMRLESALNMWPAQAQEAADLVAEDVAQRLADAAPRGANSGGSRAIQGDEPGPLFTSFVPVPGKVEDVVSSTVETTQPAKLKIVTEGSGIYGPFGTPIEPVIKQAMYWEGAPHPMTTVRGQEGRDFVTPVVENVDDIVMNRFNAAADELIYTLEG